MNAKYILEVN